ncbi:DUF3237 domain-containing protein [Hydrogenophaga sp. SL48]|jgi:hypothetical protein|uniref:DUF3237 domain-containing protein n=1 Tax=Hydrogenophaga sp. SL48 TaxID=2806347 RepID=UPI001F386AC8|nr:DUF3237 domain-containing protein [Hydrogenophaga sp. SL48]UJW80441.1 DUF3237 domain-containing protein [Hydrogenophaga sp. SL48]
MTLPTPLLEPVFDLTVFVAAPVEAGQTFGLNSQGRRRIIPITGGSVSGQVNGVVLPGGADFQLVVSETCADLDARYLLRLDDADWAGAHVFVQNRALRRGSAEDIAKLVRGEPVDPAAIYFRCAPTFEVSHPALAWMTQSLFVGTGARFPDRVQIRVFRVA